MRSQGTIKKGRVFVGISGGVDSSVSAALLKRQGYDVTGVFIKIWQPQWRECSMKEDRLDAMRVCAKLGIDFKEIDLTEEYKNSVVANMISEYGKGRTPNPDVMCNRSIKFGSFFDWAMRNGADFVATGHYTRIQKSKIKNQNVSYSLNKAKDESKDQTYFLWTLKQKHLEKTLFPVGNMIKSDVRKSAKRFGLITHTKDDSQGLCFVGNIDIKKFLSHYIPKRRGDVLNEKGEIIGEHDGAHLFTIGERHGFKIFQLKSDQNPLYVIAKDMGKNTLTVGEKKSVLSMKSNKIRLSDINWISSIPAKEDVLEVQIRYHGNFYGANFAGNILILKDKVEAVSLGQSAVIYKKGECLGGGIMDKLVV